MDPAIIDLCYKGGPVAMAFIALASWAAKRLRRMERENRALHEKAKAECEANALRLTAKVERLEDRIFEINETTIRTATQALQDNVVAFREFCERIDRASEDRTPPRALRAITPGQP